MYIPDPGSRVKKITDPVPHYKIVSIIVSIIPDPNPDFFPHLGCRGQKGTGSWIRIHNTGIFKAEY
jgi:hypothetical protein